MCCKGFAKRILPFLLTFAVGLFIASFFVSIAAPSFQFPNRSSRRNHKEQDRLRELEIQRLRDENMRLRNQQALELDNADFQNLKYAVPPPMPPAPPAPLVPQRVK